jgi:uncharacterized protein
MRPWQLTSVARTPAPAALMIGWYERTQPCKGQASDAFGHRHFAYSFGGFRRGDGEDTLPPGVTESELLASVIGPDLDNITATAALAELCNRCLYLCHDGICYVCKKDSNVTKLIEDEEQQVAWKPDDVRPKIMEMLAPGLHGHCEAIIWPEKSMDVPDEDPSFLVRYVPLEFVNETRSTQERLAKELSEK